MGEMADYIFDSCINFDDEWEKGEDLAKKQFEKICKYCGCGNLHWAVVSDDLNKGRKYRLFDDNNKIHKCDKE